jgi:hypothetical protein
MIYVHESQFAHGTPVVTGLYRQHLEASKEHWRVCCSGKTGGRALLWVWYSLHATGTYFLKRAGGNTADFLSIEFVSRVRAAKDAVKR